MFGLFFVYLFIIFLIALSVVPPSPKKIIFLSSFFAIAFASEMEDKISLDSNIPEKVCS